jgi:hypothetical protein
LVYQDCPGVAEEERLSKNQIANSKNNQDYNQQGPDDYPQNKPHLNRHQSIIWA